MATDPTTSISTLSLNDNDDPLLKPVSFGRSMRETHFSFAPTYNNLNHGSFGAYPKYVLRRLRELQDQCEARPDVFIRYDYPKLLDDSRAAVASYLAVPVDDVVLVPNASVATNIVLRNLKYKRGDVIVHFSTVYGAVAKLVDSVKETTVVESVIVDLVYPVNDDTVVDAFVNAIKSIKQGGKNPRIAIFDTVSSMPGVRMPQERLVAVCKDEGVLSIVDAAHGAGHLDLKIAAVDPDFLVTNLHKWLYTPRPSAAFYVPKRNQHLIRTTFPTSHGFVPLPSDNPNKSVINPLPKSKEGKSPFVQLFEFVATADNTPFLCIEAALTFRKIVCGGEAAIQQYCRKLARQAAERSREVWETEIMETEGLDREGESAMIQVRLPISVAGSAGVDKGDVSAEEAVDIPNFIGERLVKEYDTFAVTFLHAGKLWVRWSGQIYLEMADFEKGVQALADLCKRVREGEWKSG